MKHLILLLFTLSLFGGQVEILDSNINNKIATPKIAISKDIKINALISYVYSPSLSKVYASYKDGTLKVIDLRNSSVQTVLTGKILYSLALSPNETKLIAGIKDGGALIVDCQNGYSTSQLPTRWVSSFNGLLFTLDNQKIIEHEIIDKKGRENIVVWNMKNLSKPERTIEIEGNIEQINTHNTSLLVLSFDENNRSNEKVNYFDIESGKLQRLTEVNCSFEDMAKSKRYLNGDGIKQCDENFWLKEFLLKAGFTQKCIVSITTGNLNRNPKGVYKTCLSTNKIEIVSDKVFLAAHDNGYLLLFDRSKKQNIQFYALPDSEWIILSSNGYFKASSTKAIEDLSIKINEYSSKALTSDEIKFYNRPDIIENQIKTTIGENK